MHTYIWSWILRHSTNTASAMDKILASAHHGVIRSCHAEYHDMEVFLNIESDDNGSDTESFLKAGDVRLTEEKIADMKGMDKDLKTRFMKAIAKELDGLCHLGAFMRRTYTAIICNESYVRDLISLVRELKL